MNNAEQTKRFVSGVQWLAPEDVQQAADWESLLSRVLLRDPFSADRIATLDRFSSAIFASSELRRDPAAVALAYWLRKAQLTRLKSRFLGPVDGSVRVPCGTVFHIAPANVDSMFVYSWALSFLVGNNNVVRISGTAGALAIGLIKLIREQMASFPREWAGNYFVSYGHDASVTEFFSALCDHRVIWGGDETVARIRSIPLQPHASERAFASKFSFSVVATEAIKGAGEEEMARLGKAFAADIETFGQKACSSPHLVFWVGSDSESTRQAQIRLETAIGVNLEQDDIGAAVSRFERVFSLAASEKIARAALLPGLSSLHPRPGVAARCFEVGGGIITHFSGASLDDALKLVDRGTQTITHFGFHAAQIKTFATQAGARGCDRVVPPGKALEFDAVWDGFDLIGDFTRSIALSL